MGCYKVWFPPFLPFESSGEGSALQGASGSPCHRGPGAVLALWGAAWATEPAQIQLRGYCKATAINRVQSCSAESCWSWQHPSRTLLSEVPHSSWYNRDNATGKCTAESKKDTEKMRRRQLEVPVQSGQLLNLFSRDLMLLIYGGYKRRWKKIFHACIYQEHEVIPYESSTGPKKR